MKELRVQYSGSPPIHALFAFDHARQAIALCAGYNSNDKRFYETVLRMADEEFTAHLSVMEGKK